MSDVGGRKTEDRRLLEREIISDENFNKIYEMSEEILAMIIALIKKLNNEQ